MTACGPQRTVEFISWFVVQEAQIVSNIWSINYERRKEYPQSALSARNHGRKVGAMNESFPFVQPSVSSV